MTNFHTINDSRDYMNYFFNIGARGVTETTAEIMGMSNTIRNAIGNLAFKTSEYLGQAESTATGFALATIASFSAATKSAAEFQQAVASVEAISGKQLSGSMIGERAMQMSNKFGLAVTEMTEGLEALARAGITANNSINALLESGVQMTKFEGRDLEESINDILSTTNLLNPELNPDSDEFAQTVRDLNQQIISTSESSPINAKNIMDTLQHVGGYASSMGLNQDDLFATIAQLGAKGTKGEIAGTSLRAFLSAGQKDTAQRALSRIGLSVADLWDENQENILPLSEMKRVLDEALDANNFTTQEKIEFYSDFVGYKQANQIMKIDPEGIDEYKDKISNAMSLTDKMNIILGTVKGNWSQIQQIVTNLAIKVGSKFLPIINMILVPTKMILKLINSIPFIDWGIAIGGVLVAIKGVSVLFNNLIPTIFTFVNKFVDFSNLMKDGKKSAFQKIFEDVKKDLKESKTIAKEIINLDVGALETRVNDKEAEKLNKRLYKENEHRVLNEYFRQIYGKVGWKEDTNVAYDANKNIIARIQKNDEGKKEYILEQKLEEINQDTGRLETITHNGIRYDIGTKLSEKQFEQIMERMYPGLEGQSVSVWDNLMSHTERAIIMNKYRPSDQLIEEQLRYNISFLDSMFSKALQFGESRSAQGFPVMFGDPSYPGFRPIENLNAFNIENIQQHVQKIEEAIIKFYQIFDQDRREREETPRNRRDGYGAVGQTGNINDVYNTKTSYNEKLIPTIENALERINDFFNNGNIIISPKDVGLMGESVGGNISVSPNTIYNEIKNNNQYGEDFGPAVLEYTIHEIMHTVMQHRYRESENYKGELSITNLVTKNEHLGYKSGFVPETEANYGAQQFLKILGLSSSKMGQERISNHTKLLESQGLVNELQLDLVDNAVSALATRGEEIAAVLTNMLSTLDPNKVDTAAIQSLKDTISALEQYNSAKQFVNESPSVIDRKNKEAKNKVINEVSTQGGFDLDIAKEEANKASIEAFKKMQEILKNRNIDNDESKNKKCDLCGLVNEILLIMRGEKQFRQYTEDRKFDRNKGYAAKGSINWDDEKTLLENLVVPHPANSRRKMVLENLIPIDKTPLANIEHLKNSKIDTNKMLDMTVDDYYKLLFERPFGKKVATARWYKQNIPVDVANSLNNVLLGKMSGYNRSRYAGEILNILHGTDEINLGNNFEEYLLKIISKDKNAPTDLKKLLMNNSDIVSHYNHDALKDLLEKQSEEMQNKFIQYVIDNAEKIYAEKSYSKEQTKLMLPRVNFKDDSFAWIKENYGKYKLKDEDKIKRKYSKYFDDGETVVSKITGHQHSLKQKQPGIREQREWLVELYKILDEEEKKQFLADFYAHNKAEAEKVREYQRDTLIQEILTLSNKNVIWGKKTDYDKAKKLKDKERKKEEPKKETDTSGMFNEDGSFNKNFLNNKKEEEVINSAQNQFAMYIALFKTLSSFANLLTLYQFEPLKTQEQEEFIKSYIAFYKFIGDNFVSNMDATRMSGNESNIKTFEKHLPTISKFLDDDTIRFKNSIIEMLNFVDQFNIESFNNVSTEKNKQQDRWRILTGKQADKYGAQGKYGGVSVKKDNFSAKDAEKLDNFSQNVTDPLYDYYNIVTGFYDEEVERIIKESKRKLSQDDIDVIRKSHEKLKQEAIRNVKQSSLWFINNQNNNNNEKFVDNREEQDKKKRVNKKKKTKKEDDKKFVTLEDYMDSNKDDDKEEPIKEEKKKIKKNKKQQEIIINIDSEDEDDTKDEPRKKAKKKIKINKKQQEKIINKDLDSDKDDKENEKTKSKDSKSKPCNICELLELITSQLGLQASWFITIIEQLNQIIAIMQNINNIDTNINTKLQNPSVQNTKSGQKNAETNTHKQNGRVITSETPEERRKRINAVKEKRRKMWEQHRRLTDPTENYQYASMMPGFMTGEDFQRIQDYYTSYDHSIGPEPNTQESKFVKFINDLLEKTQKVIKNKMKKIQKIMENAFDKEKFSWQMEGYHEAVEKTTEKIDAASARLGIWRDGFQKLTEISPKFNIPVAGLNMLIDKTMQLSKTIALIDTFLNGSTTKQVTKYLGKEFAESEIGQFVIHAIIEPMKQGIKIIIGAVWKTIQGAFTALIESGLIIPLGIIAAAVAAIAGTLKIIQSHHDKNLKKLQEEQKEKESSYQAARASYQSAKSGLNKQMTEQERARAEMRFETNKAKLEYANYQKQQGVKDVQDNKNSYLWGEYGIRAGVQKLTGGRIGGKFESQAENYEGTSKNIRTIKERTVGLGFDSSAEKTVAKYYDANQYAFAMIDAYKSDLSELYDYETKLIKMYGSQDAARESSLYQNKLSETAKLTGLPEENVQQYLDWMQTEHNVDVATNAMQARAGQIVAETETKAMAVANGGDLADVMGLNGIQAQQKAMIKAQGDMIKQEAADTLWWKAFWSSLSAVFWAIASPVTFIANLLSLIWQVISNLDILIYDAVTLGKGPMSDEDRLRLENVKSAGRDVTNSVKDAFLMGREGRKAQTYWKGYRELEKEDLEKVGNNAIDERDRANYGNDTSVGAVGLGAGVYTVPSTYDNFKQEGQNASKGFRDGLNQHSPGDIANAVNDEFRFMRKFISEFSIKDVFRGVGKKATGGFKSGFSQYSSGDMSSTMGDISNPTSNLNFLSGEQQQVLGYRRWFDFGNIIEEILNTIRKIYVHTEDISNTQKYNATEWYKQGHNNGDTSVSSRVKNTFLYDQGFGLPEGVDPDDPEVQAEQSKRKKQTFAKSLANAVGGTGDDSIFDYIRKPSKLLKGIYQQVAGEAIEKTLSRTYQRFAGETIEETFSRITKRITKSFTKNAGEEFAEKSAKQGTKKIIIKSGEEAAETGAKKAVKNAGEEFAENTVKQGTKKIAIKGGEEAAESATKQGTKKIAIKGGEKAAESGVKKAGKKAASEAAESGVKKVAKEGGEGVLKKLVKQGAKSGTVGMIPIIGPLITAGISAYEHNPFETHYNEDGSEKRAFQATGEFTGEVLGSVAAELIQTAAGGNPLVGFAASMILEPLGEAVGGMAGWLIDEGFNGILGFFGLGSNAKEEQQKQQQQQQMADMSSQMDSNVYDGFQNSISSQNSIGSFGGITTSQEQPANTNTSQSPKTEIHIENININTEDDPEKIKTAFMNLMIELQDQISPKIVSRSVGGESGVSDTTVSRENNPVDSSTPDYSNPNNPNSTT